MTYTINDAAGNIVTTINDFEKEIAGGLALLGYGYVNFGQEIANNFVAVASNFSSPVAPTSPIKGQIWMDTSLSYEVLKCFSGSVWIPLFALDLANNRSLIYYNGNPIAADVNPTPTTLVVRGTDGLIPSSSLPVVSSVGHSANADHATSADSATNANHANNADSATYAGTAGHADNALRLDHYNVFGSRNGGIQYNGNNDVALTTAHIAEADQQYFTAQRAIAALKSGRYITVGADGTIAFNGPDPSSGANGAQGPAGPQGPKGDKGDKGDPGQNGAQGSQGPQGPAGANGNVGYDQALDGNSGASGWLKMPNGVIFQWGTFGGYGYHYYPITFPQNSIVVFASNYDAQGTYVDNSFATIQTPSYFYGGTKASNSKNTLSGYGCYWFAIGF